MLKKTIIILTIFCSLLGIYLLGKLPESQPFIIESLQPKERALLIPLDSRPVCTELPQQLAALAGVKLILPPNDLLDNYRKPANTEKIETWLKGQINIISTAYISTDMLSEGGLIHARRQAITNSKQQHLINYLKGLQKNDRSLQLFQVIPRLLVSDELIPDRWYKYRLLRYSQLFDMVETFNDFEQTKQLLDLEAKIPSNILAKYCQLYTSQDKLNTSLAQLATKNLSVTIGQDDGAPFGLHHRSAYFIENYLEKSASGSPQVKVSYGADELAAMLIARSYLKSINYKPKVYVQYADKSIPNLIMPYLPVSVAGVVQEKLAFLNARQVSTKDSADFILYINCGNDNYKPFTQQAQELKQLLQSHKHVALLDLTANFEENELLLPQVLKANVPINRLCAYAGWNTFSNSLGTVLAQATIFTGRLRDMPTPSEKLQLHTVNFCFILERLMDDYVYQKKLHAKLKRELLARGINPTELNQHDKAYAQSLANMFLQNQALLLLHTNLGRHSYYEDSYGEYYLKDIQLSAQLPWNRIFEISLKIKPAFGINISK